jgi:hypothetical protein
MRHNRADGCEKCLLATAIEVPSPVAKTLWNRHFTPIPECCVAAMPTSVKLPI